MSLRVKIVLLLAALAAAATIAIGVASYTTTRHELNETVDASLESAAAMINERGDTIDIEGRGGELTYQRRGGARFVMTKLRTAWKACSATGRCNKKARGKMLRKWGGSFDALVEFSK